MRISDWSSDVCSSDLRESIGFVNLHLIEARRPAACFAAIQGVARGAYGEPRIWSGQPQQVLRRELDFPNHVLRRFGDRDAIPQAGFHRIPEQPLTCFFLGALGDDPAGEHRLLAPANFTAFYEIGT